VKCRPVLVSMTGGIFGSPRRLVQQRGDSGLRAGEDHGDDAQADDVWSQGRRTLRQTEALVVRTCHRHAGATAASSSRGGTAGSSPLATTTLRRGAGCRCPRQRAGETYHLGGATDRPGAVSSSRSARTSERVGGVETLGEPIVDRREQVARVGRRRSVSEAAAPPAQQARFGSGIRLGLDREICRSSARPRRGCAGRIRIPTYSLLTPANRGRAVSMKKITLDSPGLLDTGFKMGRLVSTISGSPLR
jgi:hypothetical protein